MDAALAEELGALAVSLSLTCTSDSGMPAQGGGWTGGRAGVLTELLSDDLHDLGVQALAHLHATLPHARAHAALLGQLACATPDARG